MPSPKQYFRHVHQSADLGQARKKTAVPDSSIAASCSPAYRKKNQGPRPAPTTYPAARCPAVGGQGRARPLHLLTDIPLRRDRHRRHAFRNGRARRYRDAGVVGSNLNQVLERVSLDDVERLLVENDELRHSSKKSLLGQRTGPEVGQKIPAEGDRTVYDEQLVRGSKKACRMQCTKPTKINAGVDREKKQNSNYSNTSAIGAHFNFQHKRQPKQICDQRPERTVHQYISIFENTTCRFIVLYHARNQRRRKATTQRCCFATHMFVGKLAV